MFQFVIMDVYFWSLIFILPIYLLRIICELNERLFKYLFKLIIFIDIATRFFIFYVIRSSFPIFKLRCDMKRKRTQDNNNILQPLSDNDNVHLRNKKVLKKDIETIYSLYFFFFFLTIIYNFFLKNIFFYYFYIRKYFSCFNFSSKNFKK